MFDVDTVIIAIGNQPNPIVPKSTPDMKTNKWGLILVDGKTGRSTKPRVWSGGDIVTGSATVISAMGAGQAAARDIDAYLSSPEPREWKVEIPAETPKK